MPQKRDHKQKTLGNLNYSAVQTNSDFWVWGLVSLHLFTVLLSSGVLWSYSHPLTLFQGEFQLVLWSMLSFGCYCSCTTIHGPSTPAINFKVIFKPLILPSLTTVNVQVVSSRFCYNPSLTYSTEPCSSSKVQLAA